jgi:hypothetical protein
LGKTQTVVVVASVVVVVVVVVVAVVVDSMFTNQLSETDMLPKSEPAAERPVQVYCEVPIAI